jgi:putative tryptophan/tyrosine transport system substrate-binding protein
MLADGLVASLARPDGNTTGISMMSPELDGKRQDILIEAVPGVYRIAALADPNVRLTNIRRQRRRSDSRIAIRGAAMEAADRGQGYQIRQVTRFKMVAPS